MSNEVFAAVLAIAADPAGFGTFGTYLSKANRSTFRPIQTGT